MMAKESDPLLARLLTGEDRLSRPEKEQVLELVLETVAPAQAFWQRRAFGWVLALSGAAALLLVPFALLRSARHGTFTAKGGPAAPAMQLLCAGHAPGHAARGDKLIFEVARPAGARYFGAFAQRGDGAVIWYFPTTPEGTGLDLALHAGGGVLDTGVVLGPEHTPGSYQVVGVFSDRPLDRNGIKLLIERGGVGGVVRQPLVIE
jgi:hypothetical protein